MNQRGYRAGGRQQHRRHRRKLGRTEGGQVVAPRVGRPGGLAPRVMLAIARMSMRPEPSVLVEGEGAVPRATGNDDAAGEGLASASRLDSENSTEFSWRCPVSHRRPLPPATSFRSRRSRHRHRHGRWPTAVRRAVGHRIAVGAANRLPAAHRRHRRHRRGRMSTSTWAPEKRSAAGAPLSGDPEKSPPGSALPNGVGTSPPPPATPSWNSVKVAILTQSASPSFQM